MPCPLCGPCACASLPCRLTLCPACASIANALCCAAVKAKGDNLRVHFKQCREVAAAIRGMTLTRAKAFLGAVLEHKEAVPFRRFIGGCSQHAQGKAMKAPGNSVRWPEKATRHFIDLLENAESNAEVRGHTPPSLTPAPAPTRLPVFLPGGHCCSLP